MRLMCFVPKTRESSECAKQVYDTWKRHHDVRDQSEKPYWDVKTQVMSHKKQRLK